MWADSLAFQAVARSVCTSVCACMGKTANHPRSAANKGNFICIGADTNLGQVDCKARYPYRVHAAVGNSKGREARLTAVKLPRSYVGSMTSVATSSRQEIFHHGPATPRSPRHPRPRRELGGVARRRRLGAFRHGLA